MIQFKCRFTADRQLPLPGVPAWMSSLLRCRGIDTEEKAEHFLHPSLGDLHDPMRMHDMEKAVALIRGAIDRGERILVYGDYDVDGICAAAVLLETLREEGAEADFRLPNRHTEGYGLNQQAVEEIAREFQLLITVDCGISNLKEVRRAKELGLRVIVSDHHELPEILPPADAVLDPLLGDYPFRRLCGAGVALKICQALQGMGGVEKRLEIAALATVADIVPLMDENRVIVREGMLRMAETLRPGLKALIAVSQMTLPITSEDIAFRLGPRLNAAGRMEDASQGVRLLMTRDAEEAKAIADHLEENNRERQDCERRILSEALSLLPVQTDLTRDRVLLLEGENWNSGLIGLVAGRLCERFHHPAIVLSRQGENAVGSCRSIPGINIFQALQSCADLFLRFGGHEQAAGLTVPVRNIPELRIRLNRVIRENCDDHCFYPVREYDGELPLCQVTLDTVDRLRDLEPTGFGNPAPVFLLRGADVPELRRVGRDGSHLRLSLSQEGEIRGGIGFGLGDEADRRYARADVLFRPVRNEYNGRVSVQLHVQAIRPARTGSAGENTVQEEQQLFLEILQEMSLLAAKKPEYGVAPTLLPEYLLKEKAKEICMTDEELRRIYVQLRELRGRSFSSSAEFALAVDETEERLFTALTAFQQTGLLSWQQEPFQVNLTARPARCAMTDSPLIRYLRCLKDDNQENVD